MNQEEKYNLVIVGGGPAAVNLLYSLLKKSKLPDFLNGLGICIIEKSRFFGAGNYEQKLTYSNSPAYETLKLVVLDSKKQQNNQQQSQDNDFWESSFKQQQAPEPFSHSKEDPQSFLKSLDSNCMALCRELTELQAYSQMINYGTKQPPKGLVGYFFRLIGNILLRHIKTIKNKLIFKHSSEVIGIQLLTDGWIQLRLHKPQGTINNAFHSIKAKVVIICTGKEQLPVQQNIQPTITSEAELIKTYIQLKQNPKVVILGAGQAAFECVDLLLNGPVIYRQEEDTNSNFAQKRANCEICCTCKKVKQQSQSKKVPKCTCDCVCYGSLKMLAYKWHTTDVVTPEFPKNSISLIADDQPRLFFENEDSANLNGIQVKQNIGQQGHINILTGLRGRAKELYIQVLRGKENRIRITPMNEDLIKEANVVIDTRGWKARQIPIKDMDGNLLKPLLIHGIYQLDQYGRLKHERGSIKNLYAFGSCSYPSDLIEQSNKAELASGESALSYSEAGRLEFIWRGLKLIEEAFRNRDQGLIQTWFDGNEFPRTGQSSAFISKADFDSDSHSVNSELVENETIGLNSLDLLLKQEKYFNLLTFIKTENQFQSD